MVEMKTVKFFSKDGFSLKIEDGIIRNEIHERITPDEARAMIEVLRAVLAAVAPASYRRETTSGGSVYLTNVPEGSNWNRVNLEGGSRYAAQWNGEGTFYLYEARDRREYFVAEAKSEAQPEAWLRDGARP